MSSHNCISSCRRFLSGLAFAVALCAIVGSALAGPTEDYRRFCVSCHGVRGNGLGPMAHLVSAPPRDFTQGSYKFRSTPSGSLPLDRDLLRVIDEGLQGTEMVGWRGVIPWQRRRALVDMVKGFSPRFVEEEPDPPVVLPPESPADRGSIARGRASYLKMKCEECHGDGGRGDGPSVPTLEDDMGRPILPSDLTRRDDIRRGLPIDMMRIMFTGMDGTPMPSYGEAMPPEEAWDQVRYMVSLQRPTPWWRRNFLDPPLRWRGARPQRMSFSVIPAPRL